MGFVLFQLLSNQHMIKYHQSENVIARRTFTHRRIKMYVVPDKKKEIAILRWINQY